MAASVGDIVVDTAALRAASADLLDVARDLPLSDAETRASETALGSSEAATALARAAAQQRIRSELARRAVADAGARPAAAASQFTELDATMAAS